MKPFTELARNSALSRVLDVSTRAAKGIGVTYATSPMGADPTAGYSIATNTLQVGG